MTSSNIVIFGLSRQFLKRINVTVKLTHLRPYPNFFKIFGQIVCFCCKNSVYDFFFEKFFFQSVLWSKIQVHTVSVHRREWVHLCIERVVSLVLYCRRFLSEILL